MHNLSSATGCAAGVDSRPFCSGTFRNFANGSGLYPDRDVVPGLIVAEHFRLAVDDQAAVRNLYLLYSRRLSTQESCLRTVTNVRTRARCSHKEFQIADN